MKTYGVTGFSILFAGFSATLFVAEAMGRIPYGIEYDRAKADYIRSHLKTPDQDERGGHRVGAHLWLRLRPQLLPGFPKIAVTNGQAANERDATLLPAAQHLHGVEVDHMAATGPGPHAHPQRVLDAQIHVAAGQPLDAVGAAQGGEAVSSLGKPQVIGVPH